MADEAPVASAPLVSVADRGSEERSRRELAKVPVVAVPLVCWLFLWSFWALWGIFVPLLVIALGRNPRAIWKEIAGFLQYMLRVTAYLSLTVEPFPGYRNRDHDAYPVSLSLEYPPRLSRWLAAARIVLHPVFALVGFALIGAMAVAAVAQYFTILWTGCTGRRLRTFQLQLLGRHGRTFAFLLTLTDEPPFGPWPRKTRDAGADPEPASS